MRLDAVDETVVIAIIAVGSLLLYDLPTKLQAQDAPWLRLLLGAGWRLAAVLVAARWLPLEPVSTRAAPAGMAVVLPVLVLSSLALVATGLSPGAVPLPSFRSPVDYAALTILVPVSEELFFRGLCLNWLLRRGVGPVLSAAFVSALFVGAHFPTVYQACVLSALAAGLAAASLRTRSLLWPILIHSCWNLCVVAWSAPAGFGRHAVVAAVAFGAISIGITVGPGRASS
ncbi:MAG: CPBP family intramembrane metalloprotease [Elusimicrobia bacterium]|nr:CPBP family intramembrane metalloprotease [Elusimicrobiota bacterium]